MGIHKIGSFGRTSFSFEEEIGEKDVNVLTDQTKLFLQLHELDFKNVSKDELIKNLQRSFEIVFETKESNDVLASLAKYALSLQPENKALQFLVEAIELEDRYFAEYLVYGPINNNIYFDQIGEGEAILYNAVKNGQGYRVRALLQISPYLIVNDRLMLLPIAVECNDLEIVKLLVEGGININELNKEEVTALCIAAKHSYNDIVDYLLDHNADPNIDDKCGLTPLYYYAAAGNVDMVKNLLKHKALVDPVGGHMIKSTPLCQAANRAVAKVLVKYGADINWKDSFYQSTPLHYAASEGKKDVAEFLLGCGANQTVDWLKATPYDLAIAFGHSEIADILTP